ncbi:hypothetical protein BJY52DRAFT_1213753 [Lactarius psammicola]|nr:hypothetical protein BJY52DRAFT_1213753 [Lactarius psammicola]
MAPSGDHDVPPTAPLYVSPYITASSGTTLPVSNFVFNDNRQWYHRTSSLAQEMVHQHPSRVIFTLTDTQPYTDDLYNQVRTLEKTTAQGLVQSDSDFSHDSQGLNICINAPTVPNATTFYNDYSAFVVLHHYPLPPPSSSGLQQHTIPIHSSSFANNGTNRLPMVYQNGSQTQSHWNNDPETFSLTGPPSVLEVASSSMFPERGLSTSSADPVPEHDHNAAIKEPVVDVVLRLREDQWPPAERLYANVHTNLPPHMGRCLTNSSYGSTPYDSDSLETTFGTASVSPYAPSPSPRPHINASNPTVSPSPAGSLADVFHLGQIAPGAGCGICGV